MPSKVKPISEKLIKRVEVKLDGNTWPIVITHNLLIDAEDLTGLNTLTGDVSSLYKPSAKVVRAILYLALKRAGADYTIEQVGDLIGPHNLITIQRAILTAWVASMPQAEPEQENPTTAP